MKQGRLGVRPSDSVFVNYDARLFDEKDVVSSVASQFNVLKGASLLWKGIRMVDFHAGDPDTGEIEFRVTNGH